MEEARYSFNIKLRLQGFDTQLTIRSDTSWVQAVDEGAQALTALIKRGAVPNGATGIRKPETAQPEKRACPVCGRDDQLELIAFQKNGHPISKYKCQRCSKWLPDRLQPSKEELAAQAEKDAKELW